MSVPVRGTIRAPRSDREAESIFAQIGERLIAVEKALRDGAGQQVLSPEAAPFGPGSGTNVTNVTNVVQGETDHGEMLGLLDDDHPQYVRRFESTPPLPHQHQTGPAVDLTDQASSEGVSNLLARSDHKHLKLIGAEQDGEDLGSVSAVNLVGPGLEVHIEPNLTGSLLTDLWGYWPLDEESGTRRCALGSAPDLSEDGGVVASVAGKFGRAVDSDKTNTQFLKATFTPRSFDAGLTVACWVNLDAVPPNLPGGIFALRNSGGNDAIWLARYYQGNGVEWGFRSPVPASTSAAVPVLPSTGAWHFLVAWWDPATATAEMQVNNGRIYNSEFSLPAASVDITGWDFDEVYVAGGNGIVHGDVDAVVVYERTLTAAERERLYVNARATVSISPALRAAPLPHQHMQGDLPDLSSDANFLWALQRLGG